MLAVNKNICAIVIPIYSTKFSSSELLSFERTINIFHDYDIVLLIPHKIKNILLNKFNSRFILQDFPDKYFNSTSTYNKLLLSKTFYTRFIKYENILIVQLDVYVFRDELKKWCQKKYSYIGAPFLKYDNDKDTVILDGIGNGGFSLRNVKDHVRVLSGLKYYPNRLYSRADNCKILNFLKFVKNRLIFSYNIAPFFPKCNEDIFFGKIVSQYDSGFRVPNPDEAIEFCFERFPKHLFALNNQKLPFSCHAWLKYDPIFWSKYIYLED